MAQQWTIFEITGHVCGVVLFFVWPVWQNNPVYPSAQAQVTVSMVDEQIPPELQGLGSQASEKKQVFVHTILL